MSMPEGVVLSAGLKAHISEINIINFGQLARRYVAHDWPVRSHEKILRQALARCFGIMNKAESLVPQHCK